MKKILIIGLAVLIIGIQFIRPEENLGEAEGSQDVTHYVEVPENVMSVFRHSCYDCHSNRTNYPWYARVNPVGFWLNYHINEGKSELNFSDFSAYDVKQLDHKLEEIAEEVEGKHMPIPSYTWLHRSAILSEKEINLITAWVSRERRKLDVPQEQLLSRR